MNVPNDIPGVANKQVSRTPSRRVTQAAHLRRRVTAGVLAASMLLQQGCYNSIPVAGASTQPLGLVTIEINERGRLLIGSKLGSLVEKVVGRIVRSDSVNVEVAVETAEDVRGSLARWGGEHFTIPREGIGTMVEKKLSRKRTWGLVGGILLGVVVGLLGIKGTSFGGEEPGDGPVNPI